MIRTTQDLLLELSDYGKPEDKIKRMVKEGALIKIKRGLYETDANTPAHLLAGVLYNPSYISFSYALSYYGFIPERVEVCTSATFGKNRSKMFQTPLGNFSYRDIPKDAYPHGVCWKQEGTYSYLIASPEKALCDMLYIKAPVKSIKALQELLFDDLRIDEDVFAKLNSTLLLKLTRLYHKKNIQILAKTVEKVMI